eukprot:15364345-Ditylum_brightwellii.AAC.1
MVTFSKPLTAGKPQGNGPQELKPIIPIDCPQVRELTKGNYHMYKLHTVPYNANSPVYNLDITFYDNGSIEEWLKFHQHLPAFINRQNITDLQDIYVVTKSMLHRDMLTAFENAKGVDRPQSEPAYKTTMEGVHMHVSPL